jgi:hypothetical protein
LFVPPWYSLLSPLSAGTAVFTWSSNNITLKEGRAYFPYVTLWDENIQNMSENDRLKGKYTWTTMFKSFSTESAFHRVIPHNTHCLRSTSQKLKLSKCTSFWDKPPSVPWGHHQGVSSNYAQKCIKTPILHIYLLIHAVLYPHTLLFPITWNSLRMALEGSDM